MNSIILFSIKTEKEEEEEKKVKKEPLSLEELLAKRQAEEQAKSKVSISKKCLSEVL